MIGFHNPLALCTLLYWDSTFFQQHLQVVRCINVVTDSEFVNLLHLLCLECNGYILNAQILRVHRVQYKSPTYHVSISYLSTSVNQRKHTSF